jgi:hypothetical protein
MPLAVTPETIKQALVFYKETKDKDNCNYYSAPGLVPPRLFGRRARTPDPIREMPLEPAGLIQPTKEDSEWNRLLDAPIWGIRSSAYPDMRKGLPAADLHPRWAYHYRPDIVEDSYDDDFHWQVQTALSRQKADMGSISTGTSTPPGYPDVAMPSTRKNRTGNRLPESHTVAAANSARGALLEVADMTPLPMYFPDALAETGSQSRTQPIAAPKKQKGKKAKKSMDYVSQLSQKEKKDLAHDVYNVMIARGFDSPKGYLLLDVYVEIFRSLVGEENSRASALHRFASLLRGCPHLFEVFHLGVKVANNCAHFASRGKSFHI